MQKEKPLMSDRAKIVYEAPGLPAVTDGFIESLGWPQEIPALGIMFPESGEDEYALLKKNVSDKYSVRIVYEAKSIALPPALNDNANPVLQFCPFSDKKTLVEAYVSTQKEYFYKPWGKYIRMELLEGARNFAEKYAEPERARWLNKDGKMVGLVVLVEWRDWFGAPADLLSWIWFSPDLSSEDRKAAHGLLVTWLSREAPGKITCAIDSFNLRSQKFFKKIGFSPKCLIINRAGS